MGLSSVMNLYNGNILCNFNKFSISFIQIILGNIDFLKQNKRFAVKIPDMLPYILLLGVKNIKSKTIQIIKKIFYYYFLQMKNRNYIK